MTPQAADTLAAIRRLSHDGVGPTITELQAALGRSGRGTLHTRLRVMRADGLIAWEPRRPRSIVILADQISDAVLTKLSTKALKDLAHRVYEALADRELAG